MFVSNAVGEYVAAEHLTRRCVEYGGCVVLTRAEIAEAKRACGSEGAHVLGFRPRDVILRRWAQTARPARFMTPADEATQLARRRRSPRWYERWRRDASSPSSRSRAWANETRVRVARRWYRPRRKTGRTTDCTSCTFRSRTTFDTRSARTTPERARREDDDAEGSLGATEAQIRAAEQAVDALAVHSYDPSDISNPTLARHHRALSRRR